MGIEIAREQWGSVPPTLMQAINERLVKIQQHLDATQGKKGVLHQASTLDVGSNHIKDLPDATENTQLVNLDTLKRYSTCQHLTRVLTGCAGHENLISNIAEDLGSSGDTTPLPYAWVGYDQAPPDGSTAGFIANEVLVWPMFMYYPLTVQYIIFSVTVAGAANRVANVGIYDSTKTKLVETGSVSVSSAGVKATAVELEMVPDLYYVAFTCDGTPTLRINAGSGLENILNLTTTRMGKDAASVGAALPATLGTLSGTITNFPMILLDSQ